MRLLCIKLLLFDGGQRLRLQLGRRAAARKDDRQMRILVVSDTHRDFYSLQQALLQQPRAETVIFLGDGERELDEAAAQFPEKQFLAVAGNCDFASQLPQEGFARLGGKAVFYTHGHRQQVKYGLSALLSRARAEKADLVLFGHTHVPYTSYEDGLYVMNPGSLGHPREGGPTYGVVDITPAGIVLNIVKL